MHIIIQQYSAVVASSINRIAYIGRRIYWRCLRNTIQNGNSIFDSISFWLRSLLVAMSLLCIRVTSSLENVFTYWVDFFDNARVCANYQQTIPPQLGQYPNMSLQGLDMKSKHGQWILPSCWCTPLPKINKTNCGKFIERIWVNFDIIRWIFMVRRMAVVPWKSDWEGSCWFGINIVPLSAMVSLKVCASFPNEVYYIYIGRIPKKMTYRPPAV